MALDFPSSPTNGQTYTSGGRTWTWNSTTTTWDASNTITSSQITTALGYTPYNSTNPNGYTSNTGTVTSVGLSVPTGLTIAGSPVTTTGTLGITFTAGYSIPTTTSQANWDTAYTDRNKWDGGATGLTAATGRTSLGATTVGSNLFTLTNPTAITFLRVNADNTVSALDAATFRTAIGAGTSSTTGTVTSVGGTGTVAGLTLTGTVTSSGNLTLGGTLSTPVSTINDSTTVGQNLVKLTNPTAVTFLRVNADNTVSALDAATFRTAIGAGTSSTTGTVTTVSVASANGFAGTVANATTTPAITISTSITGVLKGNGTAISAATAGTDYVAPGGALGTPSSGTLTNCTFPTLNQNTTGSSATFTSTSQNSQFNSVGVGTAGSGTAGEIRATANITAYYSSDRNLKNNIKPIDSALDKVLHIGGKLFDWTDDYIESRGGEDGYFIRKADFGVVAQDVEEVFPVAVRTRENGTLAVDYEKLCALAFQAIVELNDKLKTSYRL